MDADVHVQVCNATNNNNVIWPQTGQHPRRNVHALALATERACLQRPRRNASVVADNGSPVLRTQ
eukprot:579965-Lingulodinium_polyedra.AAC.1